VSIVSYGANPATVAALRQALADDDVRAQLLAELTDEDRALTTTDVNEPDVEEPVEDPEPVEDTPEPEAAELDERGLPETVMPMSYYEDRLVDAIKPD